MEDTPQEPLPSPPALTRRQAQIWELISRGLTNNAIAERLGLREKTIKHHLGALFIKLGVKSRTQAAIKFHKEGPWTCSTSQV